MITVFAYFHENFSQEGIIEIFFRALLKNPEQFPNKAGFPHVLFAAGTVLFKCCQKYI